MFPVKYFVTSLSSDWGATTAEAGPTTPFRPIHLIGFAFVFLSVLLVAWENAKAGG